MSKSTRSGRRVPNPVVLPTVYRCIRFQSRHEARWAVFFDEIGMRWDYEPEGFRLPSGERYLPDFWFPQVQMYAEVKPAGAHDRLLIPEEAQRKCIQLAMVTQMPVIILDGMPRDTNYWAIWPSTDLERPDDAMPWYWWDVDFLATVGDGYHLSEGRMYACTGEAELAHRTDDSFGYGLEEDERVTKARAYRFPHDRRGESAT